MAQLALFLENFLNRALRGDRGATAVEYALMVFLIALVIIAGVTALGAKVLSMFTAVATGI